MEDGGGSLPAGRNRVLEEIIPSCPSPARQGKTTSSNGSTEEKSILSSGFTELHERSEIPEKKFDFNFWGRRKLSDRSETRKEPRIQPIVGGVKKAKNNFNFSLDLPPYIKKHVNFYRLHFLYFIIVDLIGTLLIWLSPPTSLGRISFIDALFNSTSALCVTGLVSVKMNTFSVFNQVVLLLLIMLGGQVFTSLLPVLIRRYYFRKYLSEQKDEAPNAIPPRPLSPPPLPLPPLSLPPPSPSHSTLQPITGMKSRRNLEPVPVLSESGKEIISDLSENLPNVTEKETGRATAILTETETETETDARNGAASDPNSSPLLGHTDFMNEHAHTWGGDTAKSAELKFQQIRKRHFPPEEMDLEPRESGKLEVVDLSELRLLEYRALQLLSWLIPSYLLGIQLFAFFILRINFWGAPGQRNQLGTYDVSPTFFSAFQTVSAFQNAGFALLDLNLLPFQKAIVFLFVMGSLILVGNTLYAPTLRGIIYSLYRQSKYLTKKGIKKSKQLTETLKYLLDHPRKCFTHLFPWHQTLWLVITVIAFNFIEAFFFCLLDWNGSVFNGLSGGYKVLDATFQSLNSRSSGFLVLPISLSSPSMLVLYTGMMYVAVYPVFLSRQTSKPDEEVYDDTEIGITPMLEVKDSDLLAQARLLIARDSAYLFLAVFIICIIQSNEILEDPNFSVFSITFEVISAYGNVGLSLGYTCPPTAPSTCQSPPYSFSGTWKVLGKLVLCLIMLLGRHRGLPENIDSAITIPPKEYFKPGLHRTLNPGGSKRHMAEGDSSQRQLRAADQESIFEQVSSFLGGRSPSSHHSSARITPSPRYPHSRSLPA